MKKDYSSKKILGINYPLVGLAPMDGVTDAAYRFITKKYGNPDLIFTEFTHVMGLCMAADNIIRDFYYDEIERPVIAQIYGAEPKYFYHAAKIVCALGYDGVDINMGCPAKNVASSGAGAALIKTPDLAREIVYEVKRGVSDWVSDGKLTGLKSRSEKAVKEYIEQFQKRLTDKKVEDYYASQNFRDGVFGINNLICEISGKVRKNIPVSVKTRIGFDVPITEEWISNIVRTEPEFISLHGRTLKQMYNGQASWDEIKKAVDITSIPILANGDVRDETNIRSILEVTGAFGCLIGKGSFGNPWIFKRSEKKVDLKSIVSVLLEHSKTFTTIKPEERAFVQMRKHFGWYIGGFDGAKELRIKLMRVSTPAELEETLTSYIL